MNEEEPIKAEIILYQDGISNVPVEVRYLNETFWLTQTEIAQLFGTTPSNVSMHLSNIYDEEELIKSESMIKFRISEFNKKPTNFYNLDAVIAVGYRVNSKQATRFRQWATATLKEYIVKGFVLNDDMLKNGAPGGRIHSSDSIVAKNYLYKSEMETLNRLVTMFLDHVELLAQDNVLMSEARLPRCAY